MTPDEYLLGVGRLVGNLQSLELVLRVFLCVARGEHFTFPSDTTTTMPANHLTNYLSLGQVIDAYNDQLTAAEHAAFSVDRRLVGVRDALAHGRLCTPGRLPLTLYKFGKPDRSGNVPVEHITVVSAQWLGEHKTLAFEMMQKVITCSQARGYSALGSFVDLSP